MCQSTPTTAFGELINTLIISMEGFGAKQIIFYKMTDMRTFSNISFDIFKELSGVIFSVHFISPIVTDSQLKRSCAQILLKCSFQN